MSDKDNFKNQPTVSDHVEPVVSRTLRIRGTHSYSFRSGEWAEIIGTQMRKPVNLPERPVYIVEYEDGFIDYIAISDIEHYELG